MSWLTLRTWTLRRRVVALCVTVGLLLTALGIAAVFTAAASNDRIEDVLNRTTPMRAYGESIVTAMVDQETAIRGYAISGRDANLEPYRRGLAEQNRLIGEIQKLLRSPGAGDDDIRASLRDVQARDVRPHRARRVVRVEREAPLHAHLARRVADVEERVARAHRRDD